MARNAKPERFADRRRRCYGRVLWQASGQRYQPVFHVEERLAGEVRRRFLDDIAELAAVRVQRVHEALNHRSETALEAVEYWQDDVEGAANPVRERLGERFAPLVRPENQAYRSESECYTENRG